MLRLGVTDQSPLRSGTRPEQALAESVALARHVEGLGFDRYWLAEHHNSTALMGPAPEIMIARIAAETTRIRVGSGGVMLMHYSPYKVAENFRVLSSLFPGRIDLGVGRAPGADGLTSVALSYGNQLGPEYFAARVADLLGWVKGGGPHTQALAEVRVSPAGTSVPEPWLLGSSDQSARLAAHMGIGFSFAHFIAPDAARAAIERYRMEFEPTRDCPGPRVILGVFVLCADTEAEARDLALCRDLWRQRMTQGRDPGPWPTVAEARRELGTGIGNPQASQHQIAGTPDQVMERLEELQTGLDVDEFSVITITPEFEQRLRSYALLADACGFQPAPSSAERSTAETFGAT